MKRMKPHYQLALICLLATLPQAIAHAAPDIDAAHPELPPQAMVTRILQNHPEIRIKDALLRAEETE